MRSEDALRTGSPELCHRLELFMVGASCFALGTILAYVRVLKAAADAMTFFVGSTFFTSASYCRDHIPALVLTATLETSVAGRTIEAGARGALSKLASMPETVAAIKRLTATQEASE